MNRGSAVAAGGGGRPLYARALRLRHLNPGSGDCFLLFEAMLVLGVLLALAELVPWWGIAIPPVAVAAMVKMNDVVAGTLHRRYPVLPPASAVRARPAAAVGRATVPESLSARWRGRAAIGRATQPWPGRLAHGRESGVAAGGRQPWPDQSGRGRMASVEVGQRWPDQHRGRGVASVPSAGADDTHDGARAPRSEQRLLGLAELLNPVSVTDPVDSRRLRMRQSAARRYE